MPKSMRSRSKSVAKKSMRRSMRKSHKKSQNKSKKNLKQRLMGLLKRSKKVKSKKTKKVSKKRKSSAKKIAILVNKKGKNQKGGGGVEDIDENEIIDATTNSKVDFSANPIMGAVIHNYGGDASNKAFNDSDINVKYNGQNYKMKVFTKAEAEDIADKINFASSNKSKIQALSGSTSA